jgi:prepilin-type processing-associated H-X9-DG protein
MIRFTCECGKLLQASDEQAGRAVACPACGRHQTVPDRSAAVRPGEPERPAATGVRKGAAADDAPDGPAVTSGKAVASLVLGFLSFCTFLLAGIPAVILGFLSLGDIRRGGGRVKGQGLAIAGLVLGLVGTLATCAVVPLALPALLLPAVAKVREAAARTQSANNLKQIALAMHMYNDEKRSLPQAAIRGPDGRPLLSWRVAILPYVGEEALFRQFNLNEPWDGPNNIRLLARVPKVYQTPGEQPGPDGLTRYQVFVGPGTAFENGPRGLRIPGDFPDGLSNTILVVEAANGVPWTKPEDLPFNPNGPVPPLSDQFRSGANVAYADGSVKPLPRDLPQTALKALITRNGGESVTPP